MHEVEAYIYEREGNQRELFLYFHELLISQPHITAKIRYKIPFYYRKSWICYLNPLKRDRIELCFPRAAELSNEQGLLDFKDRKMVAGIELGSLSEIPEEAVYEIIQEALLLDEMVKYSWKNRK